MRKKYSLILLAVLFSVPSFAKGKCAIPAPDNQKGSPPTLVGKVNEIEVGEKILKVKASRGTKVYLVENAADASTFSQFGGLVRFDEIKVGDQIRIWARDCAVLKGTKILAAAMIITK